MLSIFPPLCACRELGTKQGSLKEDNLAESEGLAMGCSRAASGQALPLIREGRESTVVKSQRPFFS